jgi:hypothetical protein
MMRDLLERLLSLNVSESSIDYPREGLDPDVWDRVDDKYVMKPTIKQKILDVLAEYPDGLINRIKDEKWVPRVVGSMCTNQYMDNSDFDVHLLVPESSPVFGDETLRDAIEDWFNDNRDEAGAFVNQHPITVFVQYDPKHEEALADGIYDLTTDGWVVGPKIVAEDYDPYEDFSGVLKDFEASVEGADKLLGELRRDIIDYEVIKASLARLSGDQRKKFLDRSTAKLKEIEADIEKLYAERKSWTDARSKASEDIDLEQAKKDAEESKTWKDANARFKMIARYQYLRVIKDLEEMAEEGIEQEDVEDIKGVLNTQTEIGPTV